MRIHMLGIGGTGMGSLAGLLKEAGHDVTGTDNRIYPPMSDLLSSLGISPFEGYAAENIARADPELCVIGNVIRRDNPEAQEVLRRKIKHLSMPQALAELFLKDRAPLVIAGTHGKTSSSTLAAWLLESCGEQPGFLIGGVGLNFDRSYSVGKGSVFVIEGDEYDTAFFDKGPKFLHYRPQALVLTSIEFDHADIYRDLDHLMGSFRKLIEIMPPDGLVVANADDENVMEVTKNAPCRVITYAYRGAAHARPIDPTPSESGTSFGLPGHDIRFELPMWGEHNVLNAVGVLAALIELGQPPARLAEGLRSFKGIKRRQQQISDIKGISIIDDFAHHPTAVAKTVESMRLRFPGRRVWAIFEPRSNTSRRNIFQEQYVDALSKADRVIIASPYREEDITPNQRFDADLVAGKLMRRGTDAHHIDCVEHIVEFVIRGIDAGDVILIMSNGAFDEINAKIIKALDKHRIFTDPASIPSGKVPK